MKLPEITLLVTAGLPMPLLTITPLPKFPEMMFRAAAVVPPIVQLLTAAAKAIPPWFCVIAATPAALVPTKLP